MMIEFIGSTGSGKTTLISAVQNKLAQTGRVSTAFKLIATPLGMGGVTHPTAQNLIQEFAGLPFFVYALRRNKKFIVFVLRMLARHARFTFFTLNYLRGLERTLGTYETIRHSAHDQLVLVDEGTVLLAHSIFVYTDALYSPEEIAEFASLVPLPDLLVYIRAPIDNLTERSLQRRDAPREMRSKDPVLIEKYVKRAISIFDQLVKAANVQRRVLIVDNPESTGSERNRVANEISEFILNCKLGEQA